MEVDPYPENTGHHPTQEHIRQPCPKRYAGPFSGCHCSHTGPDNSVSDIQPWRSTHQAWRYWQLHPLKIECNACRVEAQAWIYFNKSIRKKKKGNPNNKLTLHGWPTGPKPRHWSTKRMTADTPNHSASWHWWPVYKTQYMVLPWGPSSWEFACRCRREHGVQSLVGENPTSHGTIKLSLCAITTESGCHSYWSSPEPRAVLLWKAIPVKPAHTAKNNPACSNKDPVHQK